MVVLVLIHMPQVFLFGAYKYPREVNWLSGSVLLLLVLAMAFTGQLLRWDQDAFWSIVVAAEARGGGAGRPRAGPPRQPREARGRGTARRRRDADAVLRDTRVPHPRGDL